MPAFNVTRSILIEAAPETVYRTVSDFSTWQTWSPWLLAEKEATVTMHGDPTKIGGGYSWDGAVVGAGRMEHVELCPPGDEGPNGHMRSKLVFTRPWKSESRVDFQFNAAKTPSGNDATEVQWSMAGSLPFFMFWMKGMMVSMISMDYDRGLRMLKELIETGQIVSKTEVKGITAVAPLRMAGLSETTTLDEIGPSMEKTIAQVQQRLQSAGISLDGKWLSVYDDMCLKTQTLRYSIGMAIDDAVSVPDGLDDRSIAGCNAMHVSHVGKYEHMGNAWAAAYQNIHGSKRKVASKLPGLEFYANPPETTPVEQLRADIYVPIK